MPAYSATLAPTSLGPGDSLYLFAAADTITPPESSIVVAPVRGAAGCKQLTFQIAFASAPTASVVIQASNVNADADFETVWTWSANNQFDNYTDGFAGWLFYRAKVVSQSGGGALSVQVAGA